MVQRTCPQCGETFERLHNRQVYCCKKCQWTAQHERQRAKSSPCSVDGCHKKSHAAGLCAAHYEQQRVAKITKLCGHPEGCPNKATRGDYCPMHYERLRSTGHLGEAAKKRNWKGWGPRKPIKVNGYVMLFLPDHPNAKVRGRVAEHRVVMERILGRYLEPWENVHHINGIRDDNRPENLELWVKPQPAGQRPEDLAEWVVTYYPELVEAALAGRSQLRLAT